MCQAESMYLVIVSVDVVTMIMAVMMVVSMVIMVMVVRMVVLVFKGFGFKPVLHIQ